MHELPAWLSRLTAVLLLVGLIAFAVFGVALPVMTAYDETEGSLAHTRELLARYEQASSRKSALAARLAELGDRQAQTGIYIKGATDAVAAADLQERIKSAIASTGGELKSTQILTVRDEGEFQRVTLRVAMTGRIVNLYRLLYALEGGRPYLFVDNLDVKARRSRRKKEEAAADPKLTIRFDLFGYLKPEIG